jgi:hypothetical protein
MVAMNRTDRQEFFHLLEATASDKAVVSLASRYLAAWTPAELAAIPTDCRPGAVRDVEDLSDIAYCLTRARIESSAVNSRLDEMELFFAHACARVSELEAAPRRGTVKSYLTR